MILNIQSNIEFHNDFKMQNEQLLEEEGISASVTPEKNEFSSVDSRITVIRHPGQGDSEIPQTIDVDLLDEDSPFKLRLFPVQIFDQNLAAQRTSSFDTKQSSLSDYEEEK